MPKFRLNIDIQQKGQIFNAANTRAAGRKLTTQANEELAREAYKRVLTRLGQVLQNPTGYYESRIQIDRGTQSRGVSDGGVTYGGWLEGVDPRNRTTNFKGYRTFRAVQDEMRKDKVKLAKPYVNKFIKDVQT